MKTMSFLCFHSVQATNVITVHVSFLSHRSGLSEVHHSTSSAFWLGIQLGLLQLSVMFIQTCLASTHPRRL